MSVVKNSVGVTNDVTIMRFLKDTALASPPLPSGHPLIGCVAKKALEINKVTFQLGFYPRQGETVLIKCELEQYSFGCIYGINNRKIYKTSGNDSKIQWMNGNTVVAQVDWDDDIHTYGWLGGVTNGTRWCKPIYDGRVLSDTTNTNGYSDNKAWLCTSSDASETNFRSDSTWAMRLYEVYACSYPDASDNTMYLFHYYAAVNTSSVACLMETRHDLTTLAGSLGSGYRKEVINFTTQEKGYGIQLHDLKTITNSALHDLIAILTDDGGVDSRSGFSAADNPCVLSKTGESNRNFAFHLKKGSDHIPIPVGWSITDNNTSLDIGELISGRTPKWSIWADAIKFGKYGVQASLGVITYMQFNLLKENTGASVSRFELLKFENYNSKEVYPPSFNFDSVIHIEYHNGYACTLTWNERLTGYISPSYDYQGGDERFVFPFNRESGGVGMVKLGNLPLWNYTRVEQQETQSGLEKLSAFGGGLLFKIYDPSQTNPWVTFATMMKSVMDLDTPDTFVDGGETWPMPLCSNSSQESINTFKKNGFDGSSILRDSLIEQMRDALSELCTRQLKASMMLVKTTNITPSDAELVDCSKLVASKEGDVNGLFDNRICFMRSTNSDSIHPEDRFLMGEQGGIAKIGSTQYYIGAQGSNRQEMWGQYNQTVSGASDYGKCICLGFGMKSLTADTLYTLLNNGVSDVMAVLQVIESDIDEGTKSTQSLDTYDTAALNSVALGDSVSRVSVYVSEPSISSCTTSYSKETSGTTDIYKFYISGPNSTARFNVKVNISSSAKTQTEFEFRIQTYNASDANPVLTLNIPMSGNATITGSVYDCLCDVVVRKGWSRWVNNRYMTFSKIFPAQTSDDYIYPYAYNSPFNATKVQPWGISGNRASTIGSVLFMWKDLLGTRSISTQRHTKTVGGSEKAYPSTFHMRVYSKTSGPHAWDVMWVGNRQFDTLCENRYLSVTNMGTIRRIYFHNACELIEHMRQIDNYIDALVSLWPQKSSSYYVSSDQITAPASLNGKTILVYEEPLHEPKDNWNFEKDNNDNPIPLVRFDISGLSSSAKTKKFDGKVPSGSSWATDNTYQCRVTADFTSGDYTRLPTGTLRYGEMGNGGFFRIEIWNADTEHKSPHSGSIYFIDIINTPS